MSVKPDISLYGPSIRPQDWLDYYERVGSNSINFEIVFVGPNESNSTLPDNFKFIKSNTKPAQCVEIARRNAIGDLIMNVADDHYFMEEHPLDHLCNTYYSYNNDKLLLSCRYMINGKDRTHDHLFFVHDPTSPVVPCQSLMKRELHEKIGGVDRNFIAVMWDLDIAMRVYAIGGTVVISNVYTNELKDKNAGSFLCAEYWAEDRGLLERLWAVNGKVQFNRALPFTPFSNYNIIGDTQGPKGRW